VTVDPADLNQDGKVTKKEKKRYENQQREEFQNMWAISYALIQQDPQLLEWFNGQTRKYLANPEGFSKEAFFLELNQQPFSQKYSSVAIADMDFEARFPDVWNQQITAEVENLRDLAIQAGAVMTDEELRDLVVRKRRMGLSDAQVNNILSDFIGAVNGAYRGEAGKTAAGISEWGRRNNVDLSQGMIDGYLQQIQSGDTTEFDVLQDLRNTYLASAYPAWSDRIQAGQDIYDISAPYRGKMESLLELGAGTITLDDPLLQSGLQATGPDGKPIIKPIYEFEQDIRNDPRWQTTDNAYQTYAESMTGLLKTFGFR